MRVRYTFTSDVEDAPDKVKYNLEYFKQQENSLDKSLKNIINKFTRRNINYEQLTSEIEELRLLMGKLDLLLQESSNVLAACERATEQDTEDLVEETPGPSKTPQTKINKPAVATSDPKKTAALAAAVEQLSTMSSTLQEMKK